MSAVVAVDLGGTKIEAAIVMNDGTVVPQSRTRRATGRDLTPDRLRAALREVIAEVAPHAPEAVAVGIGAAGPFRPGGVIASVNMPGVHGFRLRDEAAAVAAEFFGRELPAVLGHDGGALALAESWLGATAAASASMSMVVSTGVGGGVVMDGVLLTGGAGNAGHIGQTFVRGEELTLEELASGPSSVAWAQSQGWAGTVGEDLGRDAAAGDEIARSAIERSARLVGLGVASAVTLLDLEIVAIGGGFSHVSADYVDLVQATLREHAPLEGGRQTRVVRSALAGAGPIIGAAAMAFAAQ